MKSLRTLGAGALASAMSLLPSEGAINYSIDGIGTNAGRQIIVHSVENGSVPEIDTTEITDNVAQTLWDGGIVDKSLYSNNINNLITSMNFSVGTGTSDVSPDSQRYDTPNQLMEAEFGGFFFSDVFTPGNIFVQVQGYDLSILDTHKADGTRGTDGINDWSLDYNSNRTPQQQTIAGANNWDFTPSVTAFSGVTARTTLGDQLSFYPTNSNIPTAIPEGGLAGLLIGTGIGLTALAKKLKRNRTSLNSNYEFQK
ncbi:MAG: hypothetical protein ACFE0O_13025 [Opitutales bacterium]